MFILSKVLYCVMYLTLQMLLMMIDEQMNKMFVVHYSDNLIKISKNHETRHQYWFISDAAGECSFLHPLTSV